MQIIENGKKVELEEKNTIFNSQIARRFLTGIKSIKPLDDDDFILFQEIFEDKGYKRLDKTHELESELTKLNLAVRSFRSKAIAIWKQYNRYAQKGI